MITLGLVTAIGPATDRTDPGGNTAGTTAQTNESHDEQARQITGGATKTETARTALRLLVRQQQQHDAIAWLADH
ncbi:type II toxin-antitoxin system VapB family antitoxin [Nocardia spumae]|uniref:type II toxin-antitoxin system VapB family antitoxin n=1 Tax=Nocardia spumae TaxID=2887190 RepID=UPI001D139784|nr:hypothetical protein [Nocardia spumae]